MNQVKSPLKLIPKKPPIIRHKLLPKISFNLKDSLINFLEEQATGIPRPSSGRRAFSILATFLARLTRTSCF